MPNALNKTFRAIKEARAKLLYSQPVYVPGYKYQPWRKWVALSVAVLALLFAVFYFFIYDSPQGKNDAQTTQHNQTSTQTTSVDAQDSPTYYTVDRVIDGDTIDVVISDIVERVRFIGLDTPETVDPRKPVQCFGLEASNYAKNLLNGKKVSLEGDTSQANKDKYGRLLRYVYLSDGTNVAEKIISEGYGHEYTYDLPYKYQNQFNEAERIAQVSGRGLWALSTCNGNTNPS
jgi:endonuclease YncB( thermonuclease family)